ncbi:Mif2 protein [Maudiozyma humilis]|uniref:CENP-C homolog n=1 Tax=Maudiozyma humilis TaxID=51915 RepID=A0AAV5RQR0_MAUHU|nr:Mif2 protein [Kazachstania humilis]
MDYMNLGVTSRKTGLRVRDDVARDEYNMENVDDFFKDDDFSLVTVRKKRKRSSLLPPVVTNATEDTPSDGVPQLSTPHIFSPAVSSLRRSLAPSNQTPSQRTSILKSIDEEEVPNFDVGGFDADPQLTDNNEEDEAPLHDNNEPSKQFNTTYDLGSSRKPTKPQTPASIIDTPSSTLPNPYVESDAPDLVYDADLTIDNSPFNTSENAVLEEEVSDYGLSHSDDGSVSPSELLSSGESSSDSDGDADNDNDRAIDNDSYVDQTYIPSDADEEASDQENETNSANVKPLSYDIDTMSSDDDEYIPPNIDVESSPVRDTLRRSNRIKVPPLEYWRNEKIVYKRKTSKPALDIEKIITFEPSEDSDSEDEAARNTQRRRNVNVRRDIPTPNNTEENIPRRHNNANQRNYKSINRAIISGQRNLETDGPNSQIYRNIEDGNVENATWIKDGYFEGTINATRDTQTDEILAYAPDIAQAEKTKKTDTERYTLSVMFDKHKDTFASGILKLPVSGKRDSAESHNAFITFYVIRGVVEVTVASNKFIVTEGCSFQVPSFNKYSFTNKGKEETKLFFVQVIVPDEFNKEKQISRKDKMDYSSESSESVSQAEISQMVNLKDRRLGNSEKSNRPASVLQRLFVDSSSSDVTNLQRQ